MTNFAQDPAGSAAATAAAQRYDEDYKRLEDAVQGLIASQASLREQLSAAKEEIRRLHEEIEHNKVNPTSFAAAEDVRELTKKLKEVDEKRQADKDLILRTIKTENEQTIKSVKDLLQSLPTVHDSPPPATKPVRSHTKEKVEKTEKVKEGPQSEYVVQKGDSLSKIVAGLQKEGVKVTQEQILQANPKLKPNNLLYGQKIIIPAAPPANAPE